MSQINAFSGAAVSLWCRRILRFVPRFLGYRYRLWHWLNRFGSINAVTSSISLRTFTFGSAAVSRFYWWREEFPNHYLMLPNKHWPKFGLQSLRRTSTTRTAPCRPLNCGRLHEVSPCPGVSIKWTYSSPFRPYGQFHAVSNGDTSLPFKSMESSWACIFPEDTVWVNSRCGPLMWIFHGRYGR